MGTSWFFWGGVGVLITTILARYYQNNLVFGISLSLGIGLIAYSAFFEDYGLTSSNNTAPLTGFRRWIDWRIKELKKMRAGRFSNIIEDRIPWLKKWRDDTFHGIEIAFGNPSHNATVFAKGDRIAFSLKGHDIQNTGYSGIGWVYHASSYPGALGASAKFNSFLDANIEDLEYLRQHTLVDGLVVGFNPEYLCPKRKTVMQSIQKLLLEMKWKIK
jgi:hypothetical protein